MPFSLKPLTRLAAGAVLASFTLAAAVPADAAEKVRVALGDVVSEENLAFIVALERAKDRGVDYELTSFAKEELAIQAVVTGQSDLGLGTPYALIQRSKVPLKILFQHSTLVFFPVAANKYATWKDLDGQPFTFHGRGSGTEAIGDIIAKQQGISFGQRSYVPGSGNRIIALMNGQIEATIVDISNKNKLMEMAGDRFHVLPGLKEPASDDIVFTSADWIAANQDSVNVIVEELLRLWREMNADPGIVEEERAKRGLLADQPKEILDEIVPYYIEATESGVYPPEGGGETAARADFRFYVDAGQMEGDPDAIKVEDYWDLGPLDAARKALGG
jgi:NitT/TauT family transport system substrate-binding protein